MERCWIPAQAPAREREGGRFNFPHRVEHASQPKSWSSPRIRNRIGYATPRHLQQGNSDWPTARVPTLGVSLYISTYLASYIFCPLFARFSQKAACLPLRNEYNWPARSRDSVSRVRVWKKRGAETYIKYSRILDPNLLNDWNFGHHERRWQKRLLSILPNAQTRTKTRARFDCTRMACLRIVTHALVKTNKIQSSYCLNHIVHIHRGVNCG